MLLGAPWWVWLVLAVLVPATYSNLTTPECRALAPDNPLGLVIPPR
jgi:hypothetical protein